MPATSFEATCLEELRVIRNEITEMKVDNAHRFAELEQRDHECYGNGQPGWKKEHELRMTRLENERLRQRGAGGVIAWAWRAAVAIGVAASEYFMHRK